MSFWEAAPSPAREFLIAQGVDVPAPQLIELFWASFTEPRVLVLPSGRVPVVAREVPVGGDIYDQVRDQHPQVLQAAPDGSLIPFVRTAPPVPPVGAVLGSLAPHELAVVTRWVVSLCDDAREDGFDSGRVYGTDD